MASTSTPVSSTRSAPEAGHPPRGALAALRRYGLLLESDAKLPSVVSLVAGKPIPGSWWGHPSGAAIYREGHRLAERSDVVVAKLLSGKVTYVHQKLWPQLLAIGTSREPWQMSGLSPEGRRLLALTAHATLRTDDAAVAMGGSRSTSATVRLLEQRLLFRTEQVHTESGAHAKLLESWTHWARRVGVSTRVPVDAAKSDLGDRVRRLNEQFGGNARLPWPL